MSEDESYPESYHMARSSIVLREDRTGSDGTAPLYLRLSHGSTERYVSLRLRVKPRDWNDRRGEVRRSDPDFEEKNRAVQRAERVGESVVARVPELSLLAPVTAGRLRDEAKARLFPAEKRKAEGFLSYLARRVAHEERRRVNTGRNYRGAYRRFAETVGEDDVAWDSVTASVVRRHLQRLREEGLSEGSVHHHYTLLRSTWRRAVKEGATTVADPFALVDVKRPRRRRPKLSMKEVQALASVRLDDEGEREARDLWMFAFYAWGMRWSDVCLLTRDALVERADGWRLVYREKKGGDPIDLPLVEEARQYAAPFMLVQREHDLVFPMLEKYDLSDMKAVTRGTNSKGTVVNRQLKRVAEAAKVNVALTFHMARHSVAAHLSERQFPAQEIQRVLHHSSLAVTEAYIGGFVPASADERLRSAF